MIASPARTGGPRTSTWCVYCSITKYRDGLRAMARAPDEPGGGARDRGDTGHDVRRVERVRRHAHRRADRSTTGCVSGVIRAGPGRQRRVHLPARHERSPSRSLHRESRVRLAHARRRRWRRPGRARRPRRSRHRRGRVHHDRRPQPAVPRLPGPPPAGGRMFTKSRAIHRSRSPTRPTAAAGGAGRGRARASTRSTT